MYFIFNKIQASCSSDEVFSISTSQYLNLFISISNTWGFMMGGESMESVV
jgi:hypothetical protein